MVNSMNSLIISLLFSFVIFLLFTRNHIAKILLKKIKLF